MASREPKRIKSRTEAQSVKESDIEENFTKSSGPGGQNVNKVETCVILRHRPTGIIVRCSRHRTQMANRTSARQQLLKAVEHHLNLQNFKEEQLREKRRRQNRKRPKDLKESILESKRRNSHKKKMRSFSKVHSWKEEQ